MRSSTVWMMVLLLASAVACRRGSAPSTDSRPTPTSAGLVVRDAAVALDPRTGLEWTTQDHAQALAWEDADRHCRALAVGKRRAWRLPEIDEIAALYDPRVDAPCGEWTCHLDPRIHLGSPYVWSATARGPGARFYFDASSGGRFSPGIGPTLVRRVLCVRMAGSGV
jgi:hypothetical protein